MKKMDLTRKELYSLIWEKPLKYIIDTYGGTYQDVKDLLKKYDIPSPENGYWSRVRSGHTIEIPSLPILIREDAEKVSYEPKEVKKRVKFKDITNANVNLPIRKVGKLDELVIDAKKAFQNQSKGNTDNKLISIAYDVLNINVSPKMIDRALSFFNMLILGVRRIGGKVEVKQQHSTIIYSGERLEISLRERQNRIEKQNPKYSWESYDYIPSGNLYFKLGENSWSSKEWKDTAYTILEDKIEDILEYIPTVVLKIQELKREIEQRRIAQEKERQRQLEIEKQQTTEINNFLAIKTNAELWQKATLMRAYLTAMEENAIKNETFDDQMKQYLIWARRKVDWYDPLVELEDELFEKLDKITLTLPKKYGW
ncbi:hypothetical protein [Sphingobacterium sp. SGL-16]|uniref:hypothetical protein n=1 Tax=Sphingobacterium sp. SGL-16 TaxID=2710883 RepID=UPI0013ED65DE|nr:hypothetical protein [Sphingobacterium sp. SGL-16]NGM72847.1 hypothetical protein [Sphingobacterium sp. SGL-16]